MIHTVNNSQDWQRVLGTGSVPGSARPGDAVELLPGTYTGRYVVNVPGDPANPIVIAPASGIVIFDGEYINPTGPADKVGSDGTEMVYKALVTIKSSGVQFGDATQSAIWLRRSRGRAVVVDAVNAVTLENLDIAEVRGAAIVLHTVARCSVRNCDISRCGTYQKTYTTDPGVNFPAVIAIVRSSDVAIEDNTIHETWTEGINPFDKCSNIRIRRNEIWDFGRNLAIYFTGVQGGLAEGNLIYHTGNPEFIMAPDGHWGGAIGINQEKAYQGDSRDIRVVNNIAINLNGLELWGNQGTAWAQENILFAHNTVVAREDWQRPIVIRQQTGRRSVEFLANMIWHPDNLYGEIESFDGIEMAGNGWSGTAPSYPYPQSVDSLPHVPLVDPAAPLVAGAVDVANYATAEACGLAMDTGTADDYHGQPRRKYWTVGALEWLEPALPPKPPAATIVVSVRNDPTGLIAEALRTATVEVVME